MRYFCRKYNTWLTEREIEEVHKSRCFGVRKGHRRGKPCRMLVRI